MNAPLPSPTSSPAALATGAPESAADAARSLAPQAPVLLARWLDRATQRLALRRFWRAVADGLAPIVAVVVLFFVPLMLAGVLLADTGVRLSVPGGTFVLAGLAVAFASAFGLAFWRARRGASGPLNVALRLDTSLNLDAAFVTAAELLGTDERSPFAPRVIEEAALGLRGREAEATRSALGVAVRGRRLGVGLALAGLLGVFALLVPAPALPPRIGAAWASPAIVERGRPVAFVVRLGDNYAAPHVVTVDATALGAGVRTLAPLTAYRFRARLTTPRLGPRALVELPVRVSGAGGHTARTTLLLLLVPPGDDLDQPAPAAGAAQAPGSDPAPADAPGSDADGQDPNAPGDQPDDRPGQDEGAGSEPDDGSGGQSPGPSDAGDGAGQRPQPGGDAPDPGGGSSNPSAAGGQSGTGGNAGQAPEPNQKQPNESPSAPQPSPVPADDDADEQRGPDDRGDPPPPAGKPTPPPFQLAPLAVNPEASDGDTRLREATVYRVDPERPSAGARPAELSDLLGEQGEAVARATERGTLAPEDAELVRRYHRWLAAKAAAPRGLRTPRASGRPR